MDLEQFDLTELLALSKQVEAEIPLRKKQDKALAIAELQKLALDRGFTLTELVGVSTPVTDKPGRRTPVAAKYANPADLSQQWSGRGRRPAWVVDYLAGGGDINALRIAE